LKRIILEIQIMSNLYEKAGKDFEYFPENEDLLFIRYVNAAREQMQGIS